MSNIIETVITMGGVVIYRRIPIQKSTIRIKCEGCDISYEVTAEAVYKQSKRGNSQYKCPSCASRLGWTNDKRKLASKKSKQKWTNPAYAGNIIGKAIARDIIRLVED